MFTYLSINLVNRKFQVGSSVHPEVRIKQHLNSKEETPFHRSIRRDPNNFYWIIGTEDELGNNDRSDEQFYLNFYHGSQWCYNISQFANRGPDRTGQKQPEGWGEEHSKKLEGKPNPGVSAALKGRVKSEEERRKIGEGNKGKVRTQAVRNRIAAKLRGTSWGGHTQEHREHMSELHSGENNPAYGKKHWIKQDGERKFQTESPGPEWQNGRTWKG